MSGKRRQAHAVEIKDDDVDLNPLIDVITLLIVFFILGGKMSSDIRTEQITVPPTKTAQAFKQEHGWERLVVNVFGNTQRKNSGNEMTIKVGNKSFTQKGDEYTAYESLRAILDKAYDRADKFADPKGTGLQLPKVVLEIRADADTQYRVVQEVQQVVSDSIDPAQKMIPKVHATMASARPFVNINFTTRLPGEPGH